DARGGDELLRESRRDRGVQLRVALEEREARVPARVPLVDGELRPVLDLRADHRRGPRERGDQADRGLAGRGLGPRLRVRRLSGARERRVEPVRVDAAPVQEVVHEGDAVDLRALPLVVHSEKDAGPYVTAGMVIAHDPESGARNVSFNRMMLAGAAETGIR